MTLSSNTVAQPTFTASNQPTVLIFQLVVTDNFGLASVANQVNILVNNTPAGGPDSFNVFLPLVIKNGG